MISDEKLAISEFVNEQIQKWARWDFLGSVLTKCCEWGISYARQWRKYPEEKPLSFGEYLVIVDDNDGTDKYVMMMVFDNKVGWMIDKSRSVIYWQPIVLPEGV